MIQKSIDSINLGISDNIRKNMYCMYSIGIGIHCYSHREWQNRENLNSCFGKQHRGKDSKIHVHNLGSEEFLLDMSHIVHKNYLESTHLLISFHVRSFHALDGHRRYQKPNLSSHLLVYLDEIDLLMIRVQVARIILAVFAKCRIEKYEDHPLLVESIVRKIE